MNTAHTPGPWVVDYLRTCDEIVGPKNESIAQTGSWMDSEKEEQHANARLIAAAPTMYDYIKARADAGDTDAKNILGVIHASR